MHSLIQAALFLLLLTPGIDSHALEVPTLQARVNDNADILSPETENEIEISLKSFEEKTSNQIAILTIPSLEGESIEAYSLKVAGAWKLGQKDKDNGVLLLISRDDRELRIEVGYGLEGDLTDILSSQIITNEIVPSLKGGYYDAALINGTQAIIGAIEHTYLPSPEDETQTPMTTADRLVMAGIFLATVGIFTLIALLFEGAGGWVIYFFLMPFWALFPFVILGTTGGIITFLSYAIGFIVAKKTFVKSTLGKKWKARLITHGSSTSSSSSHDSGSSSSSSSSDSFSGGGGSFGGGGSSGRW